MSYKIVFFDVDGTLTHHEDGTIPKAAKEAVTALTNRGIKVAAATGRPLSMCSELNELGIHTLITANGAYVKHNNQVLHKITMDQEIVQEVVRFASKENHALSYYTEGFSMNGVKDPRIMKALYQTLSLSEYPAVNPYIHNEEVYLMCLFADEEAVQAYTQTFPQLTFRRWHPYVLNVLQHDVSKSIAILKVLDFFGIDPSEAAAFGDGENDVDMLEMAGLGIAMGNANEKLKGKADFVTKKSSEDGIGFALRKYGLI